MRPVSLAKAAQLAGKSRATIYRLVSQGKISAAQNNKGDKVVDVAELQRVFGDLQTVSNENLKTVSARQDDNLKIQHENALLRAQVESLERENDLLRQQIKNAENQNQRLLALLEQRLLTYAPEAKPDKKNKKKKK